ncbi:MAG: CatA-like O-acetyltransferase [Salinivirgaceae bacterium]
MRIINVNRWNRKEHFEFFSTFDEPFFGITSEIDCTKAFNFCKQNNISFFAWYLHKSLKAVNNSANFKLRILDGKPVIYDSVHASATIGRKDGTFGFSYVEYHVLFERFLKNLNAEIQAVQDTPGLRLSTDPSQLNVIHYSSLPWTHITSVSHARNYKVPDSAPKIVFGKAHRVKNTMVMSVSVHGHHGLMDGLHASQHLELFQQYMNN